MSHEIDQGAEVWFTDEDRRDGAWNHVEILDSGWVRLRNEADYSVECLPPRAIKAIHTHTTDEEEAEFMDGEGADQSAVSSIVETIRGGFA